MEVWTAEVGREGPWSKDKGGSREKGKNVGYEDGFVLPSLGEPYTQIQQSALVKMDKVREKELKAKENRVKEKDRGDYEAGGF